MPPPRRQSAPKSESKTGLVIALVFFILMTIILGVVAYMGYDGQEKFKGEAATAQSEKTKALDEARENHAKYRAYQLVTGAAGAPSGEGLGAIASNPAFAKEVGEILKTFSQYGVTWEPKADQSRDSILDVLRRVQQEKATAEDNMKKALAAAEKSKTDYEQKEASAVAAQKQAEKKQEEFSKKEAEATAKLEEAKNFAINDINKLKKQIQDLNTAKDNLEAELRLVIKRQGEKMEGQALTLEKHQRTLDADRQKIVLTDKVHGRVTKVDSTNGVAFINLGSAAYVRPGMTFSILQKFDPSTLGVDSPLPKKATLEITSVLGQTQSQARIKYAEGVSSIATPVEVDDKLYKPGWKPGTPHRWALAGHFDLNGLGRDETVALKNLLAKQGIVVDAYLDLASLKVVGDLHHGIDYLVVGTRPTGETARVIGDERKTAIETAINEMVKKAQDMGITVMQHRIFLPMSGIDLPTRPSFAHFPGGAAGEAPKPMEDKPKDEGK